MSVTVNEAARLLGVSAHEVRRLAEAGTLSAERRGRMLLVDDASVARRAQTPVRRGRTLSPRTAWAALWEASGQAAVWLDPATRSRLRSWLRSRTAEQVAAACRGRAQRIDLRVLEEYRALVGEWAGVIPSGMAAAEGIGADIVTAGTYPYEIYCSAAKLTELRKEFGLTERGEANLVVRVPLFDESVILRREHMPAAVVAVDLAESLDVRTRRAGLKVLEHALAEHGGRSER